MILEIHNDLALTNDLVTAINLYKDSYCTLVNEGLKNAITFKSDGNRVMIHHTNSRIIVQKCK